MLLKIYKLLHLNPNAGNPEEAMEEIRRDSIFKGVNLWLLVFAIFIASLGLNINSTAVIIGAMLISPLMGPINGIGLGLATNDLVLVRTAVKNFTYAILVSLATSTIYFSISPLNNAFSELLARTTPTVYDVLIAFFGGLTGILAITFRQKGNVPAGVAIATALMPPLCTAGYGIATLQITFILGALYLFTINTVFISLATFLTAKLLKYPLKQYQNDGTEKTSLRIIYAITLLTLIPSVYFGYEMIQQNNFTKRAIAFSARYTMVNGAYMLNKEISPERRTITLVYGGSVIDSSTVAQMRGQLEAFSLQGVNLKIQQGFAFSQEIKPGQSAEFINDRNQAIQQMLTTIDSLKGKQELAERLLGELRSFHPEISAIILQPAEASTDSIAIPNNQVLIKCKNTLPAASIRKITLWLQQRLNNQQLMLGVYK